MSQALNKAAKKTRDALCHAAFEREMRMFDRGSRDPIGALPRWLKTDCYLEVFTYLLQNRPEADFSDPARDYMRHTVAAAQDTLLASEHMRIIEYARTVKSDLPNDPGLVLSESLVLPKSAFCNHTVLIRLEIRVETSRELSEDQLTALHTMCRIRRTADAVTQWLLTTDEADPSLDQPFLALTRLPVEDWSAIQVVASRPGLSEVLIEKPRHRDLLDRTVQVKHYLSSMVRRGNGEDSGTEHLMQPSESLLSNKVKVAALDFFLKRDFLKYVDAPRRDSVSEYVHSQLAELAAREGAQN